MERTNIKDVLAENLKQLMAANKHSQGYVHQKTGMSQSTVGRILKKEVSATIDNIHALADLYGLLSWQILVPNLDVKNPPVLRGLSKAEREFYEKMKQLIEEDEVK